MAAVELVGTEEFSELKDRTHLRLVAPQTEVTRYRTGPSVAQRRAVHTRARQRRQRALVALALMAGLAVLSLPGHAFGGETGAGLPTDLANNTVLASGMDYVVQPGDTVVSIARLMNPLDPSRARSVLVRQLDSNVVVPGEHVLIP